MTTDLFFGILLFSLMTYGLKRLNFIGSKNGIIDNSIEIITSIGISIGIISVLFFISLISNFNNQICLVLILIVSLIIFLLPKCPNINKQGAVQLNTLVKPIFGRSSFNLRTLLLICATLAFVITNMYFLLQAFTHPVGDFDAIMIYNLRANFLFYCGSDWHLAFSPLLFWSNLDYPLLVPCFTAWVWRLLNNNLDIVIIIQAIFFAEATISLVFLALLKLKKNDEAYLAILGMYTIPFYFFITGNKYIDVYLSFYLFVAVMFLYFYDTKILPKSVLILAGIMLGFTAWIKNEGLYIALSIILSRALSVFLYRKKSLKQNFVVIFNESIPIIIGMIPGMIALLLFKFKITSHNWLFDTQSNFSLFMLLTDFHNWSKVLFYMFILIINFGDWIVSPILLMIFCFVLSKRKLNKLEQKSLFSIWLSIIIILCIEILIFVLCGDTALTRIAFSGPRLILQLWPIFMFLFGLQVDLKLKNTN